MIAIISTPFPPSPRGEGDRSGGFVSPLGEIRKGVNEKKDTN